MHEATPDIAPVPTTINRLDVDSATLKAASLSANQQLDAKTVIGFASEALIGGVNQARRTTRLTPSEIESLRRESKDAAKIIRSVLAG